MLALSSFQVCCVLVYVRAAARGWVAECAVCGHEGVGVIERARRRECVYGESVRGVACAVVVCGSWEPLVGCCGTRPGTVGVF